MSGNFHFVKSVFPVRAYVRTCTYVNAYTHMRIYSGTPNEGHFRTTYVNSADLFFVARFFSLGGSKCLVGIILGP